MGTQGHIVVIAAALAACGSHKTRPPEPAAEDDAEVATADVEDVDLTSPAITAKLVQSSGPTLVRNVLYVDVEHTDRSFVVTNTSDTPVHVALPRYVTAGVKAFGNPWAPEGCIPEEPYVVRMPAQELELAAGEQKTLLVSRVWYTGNGLRPPPWCPGNECELDWQELPEMDPRARLAEAIGDDAALDFAFPILGGCSPQPFFDAIEKTTPVVDVGRVEAIFHDLGIPAAPVFEEVRRLREDTVTTLRTELDTFRATGTAEGLQIRYLANDPSFAARFRGDAEVAALVRAYAGPMADGTRLDLAYLLDQLEPPRSDSP